MYLTTAGAPCISPFLSVADVAQLAEHTVVARVVVGSIPIIRPIQMKMPRKCGAFFVLLFFQRSDRHVRAGKCPGLLIGMPFFLFLRIHQNSSGLIRTHQG